MGTETSWTTKDWPTPSPTVKPTSKFNLFTFWSQHRTTIHLFCCFSSLSHVLSAAFVALFITTSIIDKKKNRTYDLRDFFFELNNSIKQQQRSVCLSQQQ